MKLCYWKYCRYKDALWYFPMKCFGFFFFNKYTIKFKQQQKLNTGKWPPLAWSSQLYRKLQFQIPSLGVFLGATLVPASANEFRRSDPGEQMSAFHTLGCTERFSLARDKYYLSICFLSKRGERICTFDTLVPYHKVLPLADPALENPRTEQDWFQDCINWDLWGKCSG